MNPSHQTQARSTIIKPGTTSVHAIEPMLSIDDLRTILNCSRRSVEQMRSSGKLPKPDIRIGRMPRWKVATIRGWIDSGGKGVAK